MAICIFLRSGIVFCLMRPQNFVQLERQLSQSFSKFYDFWLKFVDTLFSEEYSQLATSFNSWSLQIQNFGLIETSFRLTFEFRHCPCASMDHSYIPTWLQRICSLFHSLFLPQESIHLIQYLVQFMDKFELCFLIALVES